MLRIVVKSLLASTFLAWPAAGSSFLELPAMDAEIGRSMVAAGQTGDAPVAETGIDPMVTAAYEENQEPRVIPAPDFVEISPSIIMMVPGGGLAGTSVAALGEPASEETPAPARQAQGDLSPMVIRGGLVGEAFSSTGTGTEDVPEERPEERTTGHQPAEPATGVPM